MSQRVGKLHVHKLPDEHDVPRYEVHRCECNKEFFRTVQGADNLPAWAPLDSTTSYVEYDVDDSPLIGRFAPETPGVPRPPKTEEDATVEVHDGQLQPTE